MRNRNTAPAARTCLHRGPAPPGRYDAWREEPWERQNNFNKGKFVIFSYLCIQGFTCCSIVTEYSHTLHYLSLRAKSVTELDNKQQCWTQPWMSQQQTRNEPFLCTFPILIWNYSNEQQFFPFTQGSLLCETQSITETWTNITVLVLQIVQIANSFYFQLTLSLYRLFFFIWKFDPCTIHPN